MPFPKNKDLQRSHWEFVFPDDSSFVKSYTQGSNEKNYGRDDDLKIRVRVKKLGGSAFRDMMTWENLHPALSVKFFSTINGINIVCSVF